MFIFDQGVAWNVPCLDPGLGWVFGAEHIHRIMHLAKLYSAFGVKGLIIILIIIKQSDTEGSHGVP